MGDPIFSIDPTTGAIRLPGGFEIRDDLTRRGFKDVVTQLGAKPWNSAGNNLFFNYMFDAGPLEGHPFLVILHFYSEALLSVRLTINLYPSGVVESPEIDARTKALHEAHLEHLLGKPTSTIESGTGYDEPLASLKRALLYDYDWGRVGSHYDERSGNTFIAVSYGDRLAEARADHNSKLRGG